MGPCSPLQNMPAYRCQLIPRVRSAHFLHGRLVDLPHLLAERPRGRSPKVLSSGITLQRCTKQPLHFPSSSEGASMEVTLHQRGENVRLRSFKLDDIMSCSQIFGRAVLHIRCTLSW